MSEPISRRSSALRVTVLVPVFNEAAVLPELIARLAAVAATSPAVRFDWLFVDDGSTDGSREWLPKPTTSWHGWSCAVRYDPKSPS